jgi:hypothetical protein
VQPLPTRCHVCGSAIIGVRLCSQGICVYTVLQQHLSSASSSTFAARVIGKDIVWCVEQSPGITAASYLGILYIEHTQKLSISTRHISIAKDFSKTNLQQFKKNHKVIIALLEQCSSSQLDSFGPASPHRSPALLPRHLRNCSSTKATSCAALARCAAITTCKDGRPSATTNRPSLAGALCSCKCS